MTQCHGEPEPYSRGRIGDRVIASGSTEEFIHSLPCEDYKCEKVANGEPEVALVCWSNRPIVRKTKFRLWEKLSAGLQTVRGGIENSQGELDG